MDNFSLDVSRSWGQKVGGIKKGREWEKERKLYINHNSASTKSMAA